MATTIGPLAVLHKTFALEDVIQVTIADYIPYRLKVLMEQNNLQWTVIMPL